MDILLRTWKLNLRLQIQTTMQTTSMPNSLGGGPMATAIRLRTRLKERYDLAFSTTFVPNRLTGDRNQQFPGTKDRQNWQKPHTRRMTGLFLARCHRLCSEQVGIRLDQIRDPRAEKNTLHLETY